MRVRPCGAWGSWREPRARDRLGGVCAQGLRGAASSRRHRHRGGRGPGAAVGARDLRRAAVDPHDHRAPQRDPGGDPSMSTTPPAVDGATVTMISLIGSLADNKSALGRRYGEWAVSAPTIESAVAAAAMAQDELGHGRSTYPVLAKLGVQREDEGLDTGQPLRSISRELPDWASFIAANLVVEGVLKTFVASARRSSIEPLTQRARKILQEEGAHRVHAEAWLKRMCRAGGRDRELLLVRIEEMWADAARWPGP